MPDTGNTPVHILQSGSTLEAGPSGTLSILAGGSVQNAGAISVASGGIVNVLSGGLINIATGGTLNVAAGGSIQNSGGESHGGSVVFSGSVSVTGVIGAPQITLGGTAGRWAFGTLGLASGVGSVQTGLTTVVSAGGWSLSGVQGGLGSMSSVVIDPANFANGSVIFRGLAGTLAFTGSNGTVAWFAIGV